MPRNFSLLQIATYCFITPLFIISIHRDVSLICDLLHPPYVYSFASWLLVDWIVNSYVYGILRTWLSTVRLRDININMWGGY